MPQYLTAGPIRICRLDFKNAPMAGLTSPVVSAYRESSGMAAGAKEPRVGGALRTGQKKRAIRLTALADTSKSGPLSWSQS